MAPNFSVFACWLILFAGLGVGADDCRPAKCSQDGPEVRFPFRLKSRQPEHCGYDPDFDLYCNERNETLLELPSSEKFVVNFISYAGQSVRVLSTTRGSYPKNYQFFLNLSSSPFQLSEDTLSYNYTIFYCSAKIDSFDFCLEKLTYGIYPFHSDRDFFTYDLVSCTKLYEVYHVPYLYVRQEKLLYLNWFEPACGRCESQGKTCSMKNNTEGHHLLCNNEPMEKLMFATGNVRKRLLISGESDFIEDVVPTGGGPMSFRSG